MGSTSSNIFRNRLPVIIHLWLALTALVVFIVLLVMVSYINTGSVFLFHPIDWRGIFREGWLIYIQFLVVIYFVYYAVLYFDSRYKHADFKIIRFVYELVIVVLGGFLLNKFFHWLFIQLIVVEESDVEGLNRKLKNLLVVTQTLVVVIYGLMTAYRIFKNLQRKELELLLWQKEFTQTQFEALKNQLNPHFLFNSLSVLTSLVYVDADKAESFIEKLSKTYRYLLEHREKEAVHISKELEFLDNFCFLVEQRYGNKLQITKEAEGVENLYVLPHTLLIVLEYVIGSSSMSATKPLYIKLLLKGKNLLIHYSLQPKETIFSHLQQQFNGLLQKYHQMGKEVTTITDELKQEQIIRIPLLQQND